jgi:hypothetical protein
MFRKLNWLWTAIIGLSVAACTEPDTTGIDVQPASDQIKVFFTDTMTLDVQTIREDSLQSDEVTASLNLLGSYTDPVFGLSRAGFYTQIRLPNNNTNFSFGDSPVLDSIVLTLAYSDYYGDTITPQQIEVWRLSEMMYKDTNYFSNDAITVSDQLFAGTVDVRPKDSVDLGGVNKAPHLRLKITNAALISEFQNESSSSFTDNSAFTSFFKGVYVKALDITSAGSGCIMSFNLLSSMSKFTIYYSNSSADSLEANFEINSDCPRFNHFEHDYSTSAFGNTFPIPGTDKIYIQSMSGLKARIKIPHLSNLFALGPVAINKAEVTIPVEDNSVFGNHQTLLLFGLDSAGKEVITADFLESATYYGGTYSSTDKVYKFNIARQLQRLLSNGFPDYGMSLVSAGGAVNGYRTVIPGTLRTGDKLILKITYTKLN